MNINFNNFDQRYAFMECLKNIDDGTGNGGQTFQIQNEAMGYNDQSKYVFIMLESPWEGYTLAAFGCVYSERSGFIVIDDETGKEFEYESEYGLMDAMEGEDEEYEEEELIEDEEDAAAATD